MRFRLTCWRSTRAAVLCAAVFGSSACDPSRANNLATKEAAPAAAAVYPAGRWRLLSFPQLDRVILWVSHILIRHRDSTEDGNYVFRASGWTPDGDPPARSREEARALALQLAAELRGDGSRFAALAQKHSDDVTSRELGGSLGGVRATQVTPSFLDALQVLRWDEASGVLETHHGFHILKKSPPPSEEKVAGRHLVIRYAGTVNEAMFGRSPRSRAQALALADELGRAPSSFVDLVRTYSESEDRVTDGDMGVWSTRAPLHNGPELARLASLRVDEVSRPLDTRFGVQLLQRVPVTERSELAATAVRLRYDPALPPEAAGSRAMVGAEAQRVAERVRGDRTLFQQTQRDICCAEVLRWKQGAGTPALERQLATLQPAEIAAEPVDIGWFFLIVQRLDPAGLPREPALAYELPSPAAPDIDEFLRNGEGDRLAESIRLLRADIRLGSPLREAQLDALNEELSTFESSLRSSQQAEDRVRAREATVNRINARLGKDVSLAFQAYAAEWLAKQLMLQR